MNLLPFLPVSRLEEGAKGGDTFKQTIAYSILPFTEAIFCITSPSKNLKMIYPKFSSIDCLKQSYFPLFKCELPSISIINFKSGAKKSTMKLSIDLCRKNRSPVCFRDRTAFQIYFSAFETVFVRNGYLNTLVEFNEFEI